MSDRWIYLKIPCDETAPDATDDVLTCVIAPSARSLRREGLIDRFFFLRYFEEGLHIRYRFRSTGDEPHHLLVRRVESLASEYSPHLSLEPATYEPEIDKYGGIEGLEIAERHFTSSSVLALSCIERTRDRASLRFMVALRTFQALLGVAGIRGRDRTAFLAWYAQYWRQFHVELFGSPAPSFSAETVIADWLRESTDELRDLPGTIGEIAGSGLQEWCDSLPADLSLLSELASAGRLHTSVPHILSNFAHTFHNRLGLGVREEIMIADYLSSVTSSPAGSEDD